MLSAVSIGGPSFVGSDCVDWRPSFVGSDYVDWRPLLRRIRLMSIGGPSFSNPLFIFSPSSPFILSLLLLFPLSLSLYSIAASFVGSDYVDRRPLLRRNPTMSIGGPSFVGSDYAGTGRTVKRQRLVAGHQRYRCGVSTRVRLVRSGSSAARCHPFLRGRVSWPACRCPWRGSAPSCCSPSSAARSRSRARSRRSTRCRRPSSARSSPG